MSKESKALNESFDKKINPEIQRDLENLKWLWIDPELFDKFKRRIEEICKKNPESQGIISREIQKTQIWLEDLLSTYDRKFRSILNSAANNDYSNQEWQEI